MAASASRSESGEVAKSRASDGDGLLELCEEDPEHSLGGPAEKDEPPHPSLAMHILRQLSPGQDLTRTAIPPWFLEPRSLLERFADTMMHPGLLLRAEAEDDAVERMVRVVAWYLSGWHYRTAGVKKPTNPVIGETFAACIPNPDGTRSWYVAEQVSHRPPVSALHIECAAHGIAADGAVHTRSRFGAPQTASSVLEGTAELRFRRHAERYRMSFPTVHAHGLLVGPLRMELGGRTRIVCGESGCEADVEFMQVPMMGGEARRNRVRAVVSGPDGEAATLSGRWDGAISVERADGSSEELFDAGTAPVAAKQALPAALQGAGESRRRWGAVFESLRERPVVDWDEAARRKSAVEEEQRRLRVHGGGGGGPAAWEPRLFRRSNVLGAVSGTEEESWSLDRRGLPDDVDPPVLEWSRDCHDGGGSATGAAPPATTEE